MKSTSTVLLLLACLNLVPTPSVSAAAPVVVDLWPQGAPGEQGDIGQEMDMTKPTENLVAGQRLVRLGNVSKPTLTIYRPKKSKDTGAAVLVCPGGGYNILALDLEGTEVCTWLNTQGVTAALLKYRVPKRAGREKHAPALQDAQRALGVLRQRAKEFGLDAGRVGVLGFSAGAHLSAVLSTGDPARTYPAVDEADGVSARPDFTILIYPAYLTVQEEGDKVSPLLNIASNTPPTFLTITEDDPVRVEGALHYALALKQAKVPFELHVYPTGGHGYGLRRSKEMVTTWPDRAADWMRSGGWLGKK